MNNFDCNKCTHKNVCAYKEQVPKYEDRESDSMFELILSCKEYQQETPVPRDFTFVPFNHGWATSTSIKETECQAYRTYLEQARRSNYVGDSPCSYCLKTDCPHSHVITCSNTGTATSISD